LTVFSKNDNNTDMDSTKSGSVQSLYFTYYIVCTWTVENQGK